MEDSRGPPWAWVPGRPFRGFVARYGCAGVCCFGLRASERRRGLLEVAREDRGWWVWKGWKRGADYAVRGFVGGTEVVRLECPGPAVGAYCVG